MRLQGGVSMRHLARELGVSVVTVSSALNNRGSMSEETRERVLKTAMERGYRKDEFASINAAKRGTARTRHLVAFNARRQVEQESVTTNLFRTVYFRVCRVLGQHDCDVVLIDATDSDCTSGLLARMPARTSGDCCTTRPCSST